jgi:hydroxymethylpyrimidine/phosphomethylpyrimidine kinase
MPLNSPLGPPAVRRRFFVFFTTSVLFLVQKGNKAIKTLLTVAGFDPSSGAGITADLAVMSAHGYFGTAALTALTVQSTLGVQASQPVDADFLNKTLDCLTEDLAPAGVKIGMLASAENVRAVATYIRKLLFGPVKVSVILDPVLRSSSGAELLDGAGLRALRDELLPLVDWVTPNTEELGVLLGCDLTTESEVEAAARELSGHGRGLNVIATGGDRKANDFLWLAEGRGEWLRGEKIVTTSTHGTGCAFSTALLCRIADGHSGLEAAIAAKEYVAEAIRRAPKIGHGRGPLNLLWPLRR